MRASSLSNPKIIELLNAYFVPVYVDGTYVEANPDTQAEELAAYRELFSAFHRTNEERRKEGLAPFSTGTVHAYVLSPDGRPLDSRHVAHAGPASVIEMLEGAIKSLQVGALKEPAVAPSPQSPRPDCAADALVLHLTARYLVRRESAEARREVAGELVPIDAKLGGERSGQWSALPSEDWYVLEKADWMRLLPGKPVAVGDSWAVDARLAETLLTRFYPTTELNDLTQNRLDERSLAVTATSVEGGRVQARVSGRLKMKHAFYPGRDDDNFVEASIIGLLAFQANSQRIDTFELVTKSATYGKGDRRQPFGVAVRLMPAQDEGK